MTPDELRALAGKLRKLQAGEAYEAAAYLRACAEAEPVAWRDHVEQRIRGWRQRTMNRSGDRLALDDMMGQGTIDDLIDYVCDEWSDPAPAAPQAEPCIGNDPICPCQDGDACHYKDSADGTKAWPVPQSEPKRKPACLWSRADDDTDVWETRCGHAFTIIDGTPGDNHMEFCCYCGRPLEQEIGDSDAE